MKKVAEFVRLASCMGKKTFDTFAEAAKIAKRPSKAGYGRRPYHCPACHKYHVGTPKPKQSRPRHDRWDEDMLEA